MRRRLRYLPAAFFAMLALALVGLWVRSFTDCETANFNPGGKYAFSATSYRGAVWVQRFDADRIADDALWAWASIPADVIYIHAPGKGLLGIRLFREETGVVKLSLPYWFLALSSLALAALLAFKPISRFTVRGLLITTTLLAAVLGLAVCAV
jgi:hypothetical protein